MQTIIIYDSAFGNTAQIATALAKEAQRPDSVKMSLVSEVTLTDLQAAQLAIVGSPTHAGHPTEAIQKYLSEPPPNALAGKHFAAFDTRFAPEDQGLGLRLLMRALGFAAPRIAGELKARGGNQAVEPEGFIVNDKEGPLKQGELERATAWIQKVSQAVS